MAANETIASVSTALQVHLGASSITLATLSQPAAPIPEGIGLCLWRVSMAPQSQAPVRPDPGGPHLRPPIMLDLHYIAVATATDPLAQQRLLEVLFQRIFERPVMPLPGEAVKSIGLAIEPVSIENDLKLRQVLSLSSPLVVVAARGASIEAQPDPPILPVRERPEG